MRAESACASLSSHYELMDCARAVRQMPRGGNFAGGGDDNDRFSRKQVVRPISGAAAARSAFKQHKAHAFDESDDVVRAAGRAALAAGTSGTITPPAAGSSAVSTTDCVAICRVEDDCSSALAQYHELILERVHAGIVHGKHRYAN